MYMYMYVYIYTYIYIYIYTSLAAQDCWVSQEDGTVFVPDEWTQADKPSIFSPTRPDNNSDNDNKQNNQTLILIITITNDKC